MRCYSKNTRKPIQTEKSYFEDRDFECCPVIHVKIKPKLLTPSSIHCRQKITFVNPFEVYAALLNTAMIGDCLGQSGQLFTYVAPFFLKEEFQRIYNCARPFLQENSEDNWRRSKMFCSFQLYKKCIINFF